DEFVMKRIGGLKQQVVASFHQLTVDGRTPQQQITECFAEIRDFEVAQRMLLLELQERLAEQDVHIVSWAALPAADQRALRDVYYHNIFPLVTPLAMDPAHPFPFISNLSLNLLVTVRYADDPEQMLARVKVPVGSGICRFMRLGPESRTFVPLEDVMAHN